LVHMCHFARLWLNNTENCDFVQILEIFSQGA
jgi:hypothetical protein